jgi:hypothetical protein
MRRLSISGITWSPEKLRVEMGISVLNPLWRHRGFWRYWATENLTEKSEAINPQERRMLFYLNCSKYLRRWWTEEKSQSAVNTTHQVTSVGGSFWRMLTLRILLILPGWCHPFIIRWTRLAPFDWIGKVYKQDWWAGMVTNQNLCQTAMI